MILLVPPPVIYTVQDGDTLFGVARRFSVDPRSLANLNDIPLETRIRAGQRLILPALVRDGGVNSLARGERPAGLESGPASGALAVENPRAPQGVEHNPKVAKAAEGVEDRAPAEPPARETVAPASDAEIVSLGKGRFVWPVRGEILSDFGPKGPGQRNDGVNIAVQTGSSVRAAAAGTVVYAGDSIPAFGNLVLVKHPGGWATLYGNLGHISVKNNAQITQGEEIGTAGVSGAVDRPQVHFEIRYARDPKDKARPYDPVELLPTKGG